MCSSPSVFPEREPAPMTDQTEGRAAFAQPVEDRSGAPDIETRLTDEMRRFGAFFAESAVRLRAIGEDARDDLDKLIAASQRLFLLELSNAILKSMRECSSLAEYVDHLGELELGVRDAFREVVLEGRKFVCVALTDERAREFFRGHKGGEQGWDVHERSSECGGSQEAA